MTMQPLVTQFAIAGELESWTTKSNGCVKYLQLVTEDGDYGIEVAKELRRKLQIELESGCWLQVSGMRKYELHKDRVKYKAYDIELLRPSAKTLSTKKTATKAKILICQKSTCWQRGGKAICKSLKQELSDRGISDSVKITKVGCLKQCKQAPNLVMMPDKVRYSRVCPTQVPNLVKKHFLAD